jgi:hypothetical protein
MDISGYTMDQGRLESFVAEYEKPDQTIHQKAEIFLQCAKELFNNINPGPLPIIDAFMTFTHSSPESSVHEAVCVIQAALQQIGQQPQ